MKKEIQDIEEIQQWFKDRSWNESMERQLQEYSDTPRTINTKSTKILFPTSTQNVADILSQLDEDTKVVAIAGGHSSSNSGTGAAVEPHPRHNVVVLDLQHMDTVAVDHEAFQVTVGGGTLFRELALAVADAGGALPIGTGDTVGVAGYVLNGGLSGYFGRRLGMLGHCTTSMTLVTADGSIKELKASCKDDKELFQAVLGAGPALGIVTSLTFQMEKGTCIQTGGQLVVPCGDLETAQTFTRSALGFLRDVVLDDLRVSMELVVTADFTAISTLVFYDSFQGNPSLYVEPLREAAKALNLPVVVNDVQQWTSWFEVASCLWPIIAEMQGNPMVRIDHCVGTRSTPTDAQLDFVAQDWLGGVPHQAAPMSIMECRTLGGAMLQDDQAMAIPSSNSNCVFFCDMIVAFDGQGKSREECQDIAHQVDATVALARSQPGFQVDFSATHSQWNDAAMKREEVFGNASACHLVQSTKQAIDPSNRFCFHSLVLADTQKQ